MSIEDILKELKAAIEENTAVQKAVVSALEEMALQ